ncbi:MAG: hypothetical protein ACQEVT_16770 [Pseudomonadota bacterium]
MSDVQFPYTPRKCFLPSHALLAQSSTKMLVLLCARRIGKTWFGLSAIATGALNRPGRYGVIYPLQQTGKRVAWPILRELLAGIPGAEYRRGDLEIEVPCANGSTSIISIHGASDDDGGGSVRGSEFVGIFVDEVAQVGADAFYGAILPTTNNVPCAWMIASGTPRGMDLLGDLYDAASAGTEPGWHAIHLPATGVPEVYSLEEIDRLRRIMPAEKFQREIMANHRVSDELAMIPLESVVACQSRTVPEAVKHTMRQIYPTILGVDVGLSRDESVIVLRMGPAVIKYWRLKEPTAPELATKIAGLISEFRVDACFIDNGSAGAAVIDILIQLGRNPIRVNFGGTPEDPEKYQNVRAEMYQRLADWCQRDDSVLPADDLYVARQLSASRYMISASNKLQIERKDAVRKRLGSSPDFADALALSFRSNVINPRLDNGALRLDPGDRQALIEYGVDGSRYTNPKQRAAFEEKRRRCEEYQPHDDGLEVFDPYN